MSVSLTKNPHHVLTRRATLEVRTARRALADCPTHERIQLAVGNATRLLPMVQIAEQRGATGTALRLLDRISQNARYARFEADRNPRPAR